MFKFKKRQRLGFVIRVYDEQLAKDVYYEVRNWWCTKKAELDLKTIERHVYLTAKLEGTDELEKKLQKKFGDIAVIRQHEPYIIGMSKRES